MSVGASKFSNVKGTSNIKRGDTVSEDDEYEYEDDFESLSKSQVGLSMSKAGRSGAARDSYS